MTGTTYLYQTNPSEFRQVCGKRYDAYIAQQGAVYNQLAQSRFTHWQGRCNVDGYRSEQGAQLQHL